MIGLPQFGQHLELMVSNDTSASDILNFIVEAQYALGPSSKAGLRAVRQQEKLDDGSERISRVLFVRTGWDNPWDWLVNRFNRDEQYQQAAKIVADALGDLKPMQGGDGKTPTPRQRIRPAECRLTDSNFKRNAFLQFLSLYGVHKELHAAKGLKGGREDKTAGKMRTGRATLAYVNFAPGCRASLHRFLGIGHRKEEVEKFDNAFDDFVSFVDMLRNHDAMLPTGQRSAEQARMEEAFLERALAFAEKWFACRQAAQGKSANHLSQFLQVATIDYLVASLLKRFSIAVQGGTSDRDRDLDVLFASSAHAMDGQLTDIGGLISEEHRETVDAYLKCKPHPFVAASQAMSALTPPANS